MKNDILINNISVASTITLEKPYLFKPYMVELPIVIRVSLLDFLDTFGRNINNEGNEIDIIFTSDLKDMTFAQYMAQPKSMLWRKLVRNFIEGDFGDFNYNCVNFIDDAIVENIGKYIGISNLENIHKYLIENGQSDFVGDRVTLSNVLSQIKTIIGNNYRFVGKDKISEYGQLRKLIIVWLIESSTEPEVDNQQ